MMIIFSSCMFQNAAHDLKMHAMISLALEGLHRISIDNDRNPAFMSWFQRLPPSQQEQWQQVIDEGYRLEALEPARRTVIVADTCASDWDAIVPILTPIEAHQLMRQPFYALLENAFSDRHFILCMANDEQRRFIEKREEIGALNFENGGGITEMPKRLEEAARRGKREISRLWALFDSDALKPDEPSSHSEYLRAKCVEFGIPHHQLKRRSIENYIPRRALQAWAFNDPKLKKSRRPIYEAFVKITAIQRCHYNMKEGFSADMKRNPPPDLSLFDGIDGANLSLLSRGFDKKLADLYKGDLVSESDLTVDGCWAEMNPVITSLIALLR